jgi:glycine/D-amino acid oxidase-like deaminating enzyme
MTGTERSARFRIAVIGKGLIGSAAARHLSLLTDGVALIGPDEPTLRSDHHDVFGSHYDEGRDLLNRTLVSLIPDPEGAPIRTDTCVVTTTATG